MIVEIAAFTPGAAIAAFQAGAGRIELCSGYSEGGLSPSAGTVMAVRKAVKIPVHVMIRPRIGDFIYTDFEKEAILEDIDFCRNVGANGIVFGAMLADGRVDKGFTRQVVNYAENLSVTFHRAFDLCKNLNRSLNDLIDCGVHRVLTSGGKNNAPEGASVIKELVREADGKIIVLPGGGLTPENISDFVAYTGVKEIHFSGKTKTVSSLQAEAEVNLTSHGEVNDTTWYESDPEKIRQMVQVLQS